MHWHQSSPCTQALTYFWIVEGEGREKRKEREDGQWWGKTVDIKFGKKTGWNWFVKGTIYKSSIPLTLDWRISLCYLCSFRATQPSMGKELRFVQQNEKPLSVPVSCSPIALLLLRLLSFFPFGFSSRFLLFYAILSFKYSLFRHSSHTQPVVFEPQTL